MAETDIANETYEIEDLLQAGQAALDASDMYEARKHFRRATEQYPDSGAAWFGLARAVLPYKDQQTYLQRVLELESDHAEARAELAEVEQKLAAGEVMAPRRKPAPLAEPAKAEPPDRETAPQETVTEDPFADIDDPFTETDTLLTEIDTCYRHPDRETGLHCIQCGNPVCSECARPAFVGQLCPDCARERRPINYQVSASHLLIAGSISLIVSAVSSFLVTWLLAGIGFFGFFIVLFLAPLVARLLVRLLDYATRAKRGRPVQITVGVSIGMGALPLLLFLLSFSTFSIIIVGVFIALMISTTMYQLR